MRLIIDRLGLLSTDDPASAKLEAPGPSFIHLGRCSCLLMPRLARDRVVLTACLSNKRFRRPVHLNIVASCFDRFKPPALFP